MVTVEFECLFLYIPMKAKFNFAQSIQKIVYMFAQQRHKLLARFASSQTYVCNNRWNFWGMLWILYMKLILWVCAFHVYRLCSLSCSVIGGIQAHIYVWKLYCAGALNLKAQHYSMVLTRYAQIYIFFMSGNVVCVR